ncbi:hypothetical protein ABZ960_43370 [Streptomyces pseudovenezuelae]
MSPASVPGRVWLLPALATVGFAVNFWAPTSARPSHAAHPRQ